LQFSFRQITDLLTEVTEARSLENNALKAESRTIYANFRNIAQNLFRLSQIFSLIIAENFAQNYITLF